MEPNCGSMFLKIMFGDFQKRLELPSKFVRKLGNKLSDQFAVLKVPSGDIWEVKLTKTNDKIWFEKNRWEEFVKFYSIRVAFLLTFEYVGNSSFDVVIYDLTAAEIYYPRRFLSFDQPKPNEADLEGTNATKQEENCRVPQFNSLNPSFKIIMQPTYVMEKYALNFPFQLMKRYIGTENRVVKLVSNGRTWRAKCHMYEAVAKLYKWRAFATDNALRVGDICLFELTDPDDIEFKVTITRNSSLP